MLWPPSISSSTYLTPSALLQFLISTTTVHMSCSGLPQFFPPLVCVSRYSPSVPFLRLLRRYNSYVVPCPLSISTPPPLICQPLLYFSSLFPLLSSVRRYSSYIVPGLLQVLPPFIWHPCSPPVCYSKLSLRFLHLMFSLVDLLIFFHSFAVQCPSLWVSFFFHHYHITDPM